MANTFEFSIPSTGKQYKIIATEVMWPHAVDNSNDYGGSLAQFETETEANNFWEVFSSSDFYRDIETIIGDDSTSIDGGNIKYMVRCN